MKYEDIIILRDTREKDTKGWQFEEEIKKPGNSPRILGTEEIGLETGDYQIKGMPNLCVIERKFGLLELVGNFSPINNKDRFEREMERMQKFKYKYLLVEGILNKDILGMSIQQFKYGLPMSKVVEWLLEIQIKYGFFVWFVGDAGPKIARRIFKMAAREYYNGKTTE